MLQAASVPAGSFLTKSVSNPEDLARLIETDKRVGQRYTRHFGMGVKEMADYVRKNLKVSQMKTSGTLTTYYITKGDRILVHKKSFKAGRKIFVTPDGKPAIDVCCGNPLVRSLPKIVVKVEPKKEEVIPPTPVVEQPPVVAEIPTTPPQFETPVQEAPPVEVASLPLPEPEVAVLDLPPTEFSSAASLLSSGIVPGLIAVGAASAVFGGKGGGEEQPVPEPTGLIAMASGLTMFAAGIRMRRRSGRDVSNSKR
jgi:hypothetical protein